MGPRTDAACAGSPIPLIECQALVTLYNATGGDAWDENTNWGTDPNPCNWWGITCTEEDHGSVRGIWLNSNGLSGTLPAGIGDFGEIRWLRLAGNSLSGTIPDEVGDLTTLVVLSVGHNDFTGPLPATLANLANLEILSAGCNQLTGPIPAGIAHPGLAALNLHWNQLSGPIPPELGNATQLTHLFLSNNAFTGPVPAELGALTDMIEFSAYNKDLSGIVPLELPALLSGELVNCLLGPTGNEGLSIPDLPEYRAYDFDDNGMLCSLPFSAAGDIGEDAVNGIEELVPDPLGAGVANALTTKIENALAKAAAGQYQAAINQMNAFIGQVEDLVSNGVLTQVQADPFLQQAQALIDLWTPLA